jgi:hypothetical protein
MHDAVAVALIFAAIGRCRFPVTPAQALLLLSGVRG